MDSNDFWCRAFLAAMGGHYTPTDEGKVVDHGPAAAFCEEAADAALEVAQRRGMVTGEREAPEPDVLRWLAAQDETKPCGARFGVWRPSRGAYQDRRFYARRVEWTSVGLCLVGDEGGQELAFAAFHIMRDWTRVDAPAEAPGPKLERVEFTAERGDHGLWNLSAPELGAGVSVLHGSSVTSTPDGTTVRIKWGESITKPRPLEVWIERG